VQPSEGNQEYVSSSNCQASMRRCWTCCVWCCQILLSSK